MEYNYSVREGELLQINSRKARMVIRFAVLFRFLKMLLLLFSFGVTVHVTYLIFRECITDAALTECIPLGSIFATFGSAVISVISLYCNKQSSLFQENLMALHEQVPGLSSWKRWPFMKRYSRERSGLFRHTYHVLRNPQITFQGQKRSLTIPLPTCTADFYDLPIVVNAVKMLCFYQTFLKSAAGHRATRERNEISTFYCTLVIYRNIIRYKAGTFLMLIGSEFVLASIIFSFFYGSISELLALAAG